MNRTCRFFILTLLLTVIAKDSIQGSIKPRITNGREAEPHSAPFIVSLKYWGQHDCGGSIIDNQWVLTAAHCIRSDSVYASCMSAGLHNGGPEPYDIALLHVSSPFKFNKYVQPIELPSAEKIHEGKVILYGWGGTTSNRNSPLPQKLQTASITIIPYNVCKKVSLYPELHSTNVCTDAMNAGVSGCSGDSGGPLIKEVNRTRELVGIVSWGPARCGETNLPSVYTRVSAFTEWIAEKKAIQKAIFI